MPETGSVLVVDDEADIANLIELYLRREGFRVHKAGTGAAALQAADEHRPRLVIIDIGLPDIDGFEVCRELRRTSRVPVIFLTARGGEADRVRGLEMGGDDYVAKPFSPAELVARVRAVLRRSDGTAPSTMTVGAVTVDSGRREVKAGGAVVPLTVKEFDLLRYLATNAGLALSRQQILDGAWGHDWYGDIRTIDVHIAALRRKLGSAVAISTVRGIGYRLEPT